MVLDTRVSWTFLFVKQFERPKLLGRNCSYNTFVKEKFAMPITEPLPKNKLALFGHQAAKISSSKQEKKVHVAALKNDCSRLYISCQTRDGDLDTGSLSIKTKQYHHHYHRAANFGWVQRQTSLAVLNQKKDI